METLLKVIALLMRAYNFLAKPVIVLVGGRRRVEPFPAIRNELLKVSATELAERIRNRTVRSQDVVQAYIDRIREVNPLINAVVEERFDAALEEAKQVDVELKDERLEASELAKWRPLLGVPVTVKENCSLKGLSYTGGVYHRRDVKASEDGEAVARMRAAGAIPLLVSNTPEFGMSYECFNYVTGRTLNPYDGRRTCGGSSGGEGALLGSGASLCGVASDLAGSIRVPALFCGVFGHKPTGAVVPIKGHLPMVSDAHFDQLLSLGPMTRYAADLPLLLGVMAGPEADRLRLDQPVRLEKVRLFYPATLDFEVTAVPVDGDTRDAVEAAVRYFQGQGIEPRPIELRHYRDLMQLASSSLTIKDVPIVFEDQGANLFWELAKVFVRRSRHTFAALYMYLMDVSKGLLTEEDHKDNRRKGQELKQDIERQLGTDGVLLMPSYSKVALRHYESFGHVSGFIFTMFTNALGLPSTQVPLGLNADGLPTGIQIVAAPYQDRLCLRVAQELEKGFGGWIPPK